MSKPLQRSYKHFWKECAPGLTFSRLLSADGWVALICFSCSLSSQSIHAGCFINITYLILLHLAVARYYNATMHSKRIMNCLPGLPCHGVKLKVTRWSEKCSTQGICLAHNTEYEHSTLERSRAVWKVKVYERPYRQTDGRTDRPKTICFLALDPGSTKITMDYRYHDKFEKNSSAVFRAFWVSVLN